MADIAKITLPDGNTYDLKDASARNAKYDKANANTSDASAGTVSGSNFSFTGTKASLTHSTTTADVSVTFSYTPAGTIASVVKSLTTASKTVNTETSKVIGVNAAMMTISHSITGEKVTSSGNFTPSGSVALTTADASTTSVAGINVITRAKPAFTGTMATISVTSTTKYATAVGAHSYTPAGTISNVVKAITGTPVAASYTTAGEVLILTNCTVTTGAPTFTGTNASITHSLTTSAVSASGTYTPSGTIATVVTNLTSTAVTVNNETVKVTGASFSGIKGAISVTAGKTVVTSITDHTFTPGDSISLSTAAASTTTVYGVTGITSGAPTFTGTSVSITGTSSEKFVKSVSAHSYTPAGSISGSQTLGNHKHTIGTTATTVSIS